MPSYDYRCEVCKKTFEVQQSIKNVAATVPCARCGEDCERYFGNTVFGIGLCDTQWVRENWHNREFERDPRMGDHYHAGARRAGVSTTGKRYSHALADYPGDPEAWVGSLSEAKEAACRKGLSCSVEDGTLKVTGESHFRRRKRLQQEAQQQKEQTDGHRTEH